MRQTQNADGGWGMQPGDPSDDISTAYGLIALCYGDDSQPVGRALSWLPAQQKADGGFGGPPDMVGPRPFTYHFPLLTDIPVLLALGHVRSRVLDPAAALQGYGDRRRDPALAPFQHHVQRNRHDAETGRLAQRKSGQVGRHRALGRPAGPGADAGREAR
ncbi:hypothetical protein ACWD6R_09065 [Streptomyces sp. NPDC005151]